MSREVFTQEVREALLRRVDPAWLAAVAYGHGELLLTDAAIAAEICCTREYIRHLRGILGLVVRRCACGRKLVRSGELQCPKCKARKAARLPCLAGCGRRCYVLHPTGRCGRCRYKEKTKEARRRGGDRFEAHRAHVNRWAAQKHGSGAVSRTSGGVLFSLAKGWGATEGFTLQDLLAAAAALRPDLGFTNLQARNAVARASKAGHVELVDRRLYRVVARPGGASIPAGDDGA